MLKISRSVFATLLMFGSLQVFAANKIKAGEYLNSHKVMDFDGEVVGVQDRLNISEISGQTGLRKVEIYVSTDGGASCSVEENFELKKNGNLEFQTRLVNFDNQACKLVLRSLGKNQVEVLDIDSGCEIEMCGRASLNGTRFLKVLE